MKKKSFLFFGEIIEPYRKDNIELFESYVLKKANNEQIQTIQNFIADYNKILHHGISYYEYYTEPKCNGFIFNPLEKKDWKYWVIEYPEINMKKSVPFALGLSKIDLTVLFSGAYNGLKKMDGKEIPGVVSNQLKTLNFFYNTQFDILETKPFTKADVNEINSLFYLLQEFQNNKNCFDFIDKALQDYLNLQNVPKNSTFRILGYFSILELLLTVYGPEENSINNQLRTKINLVNNQIKEPINFREYFGGSDTNKLEMIIAKLYQYRNDIAHGNKSDFEKKLRIFKNSKCYIQEFLRDLTKKILIFAIEKPELTLDLKNAKK